MEGTFRIMATLVAGGVQLIVVNEETNERIGQVEFKPNGNVSGVVDFRFDGTFSIAHPYVVDADGKRHFRMTAETAIRI